MGAKTTYFEGKSLSRASTNIQVHIEWQKE